jgi:acetylornithine deacetylase/succinyl-diaminopimelate desuccinylase-like protein
LATEPKTLVSAAGHIAHRRGIAQLANESAFAEGQRWFSRERTWINERHLQLCRIPAPTFFEQQRAEWFRSQFESLGWNAQIDRAGNVVAKFGNGSGLERGAARFVVSAHLDAVIAPKRPEEIYYGPDERLFGPGVSDNGSGLAALLAFARMLKEVSGLHDLASSLLLVANVGEEGEGNLSGIKYLCRQTLSTEPIQAFIVLDGPAIDHITTQALASRRFEISFTGPGGHSWTGFGVP